MDRLNGKESLIGTILAGKYEIIERIGSGGMGVIYKANQISLNRIVAIKMLSPELFSDANFVERFKREARAAARVTHENVVRIYDVDVHEGTHFIVMEFVEGETLDALMKEHGQIPLTDVANIITQVCAALQVAHRSGIVHRDIKPQNIMILRETGRVKVMDFGIARVEDPTFKTQTGSMMGTPTYMSPEQAKGEPLDSKSDIYSLGVVLYQMVTGQLPFEGTTLAVAMKHVGEEPPTPRSLRPDIPQTMEEVILRAMAKEVDDRFKDAGALADALNTAVRGSQLKDRGTVIAAPTMAMSVPLPVVAAWKKRRMWTLAVLVVAVLIGVSAGAYFFFNRPKEYQEVVKDVISLPEQPAPVPDVVGLEPPGTPLDSVTKGPDLLEHPVQIEEKPELTEQKEKSVVSMRSADALFSQRRYSEAMKAYEEALQSDPDNPEAKQGLEEIISIKNKMLETAMGYLRNRDFARAKKTVEDVIAIDGKDGKAAELLAGLQRDKYESIAEGKKAFDAGAFPKAKAAFEIVGAIDPESPEAVRYLNEIERQKEGWVHQGIKAFEEGRYRDAGENFKKVLAVDERNDNVSAYREKIKKIYSGFAERGKQEFAEEQYVSAGENFRSALKIEDSTELKSYLERIAEKEKETFAKAEELLQQGAYAEAENLCKKFGERSRGKELLMSIGEIKEVLRTLSLFDAAVEREDLSAYCAMIDQENTELVAEEEKNLKNLFVRFDALKSERSGVRVSVEDGRAVATAIWNLSAEHQEATERVTLYQGEFAVEFIWRNKEWKVRKSGFQ